MLLMCGLSNAITTNERVHIYIPIAGWNVRDFELLNFDFPSNPLLLTKEKIPH